MWGILGTDGTCYLRLMNIVTGKEFQGVTEGGAAAAGGYIWLTWVVGGAPQTVLFEQSLVGPLMAAIGTSAAMAADERQRQGLLEPNSAYALEVVSVAPAKSETALGAVVLDVSIDAHRDKPWHLYLSADRAALEGMRGAIDRALRLINEKAPAN